MTHCILQVPKYLYSGGENGLKIQRENYFKHSLLFLKGKKNKWKQHGGNSLIVIYFWQHLAATVFSKLKGA